MPWGNTTERCDSVSWLVGCCRWLGEKGDIQRVRLSWDLGAGKKQRHEDLEVSSFEGERTASAKALGRDQAQRVSRIKRPVKRDNCGREEGRDSVVPWETHYTGCCKGGCEYRSPAGVSILLIGVLSQKPISWRWTPDVNNEDWKLLFHAESSSMTSVFSLWGQKTVYERETADSMREFEREERMWVVVEIT